MPSRHERSALWIDRSRDMEETAWWDFWNTSYRVADNCDEVSSELFARAAAVINEITQAEGGRVLEVACGAGSLSRLLKYSSYHGIDISPAAIQIARQKTDRAPRRPGTVLPIYEAADFHNWPLPAQSFDVVACIDAISCFRDQQLVLKKIAQCLRNSGRLVLTTINPFVYWRIKSTWQNGPVSHWLSRDELHALISSAGFIVERSHTIMPRGHLGILRLINSRRVEEAVGPRIAARLRRLKERAGLGQYRVVVARKDATAR